MRAAARGRMREGGLWPLLAGFALAFLLSSLADNLIAWIGAWGGWITHVSALELADAAGLVLAPEHEKILESVSIPQVAPVYRILLFLFNAAWEEGILAFGYAVLAIAVLRRGAKAFLVLSGFRWPLLPRTMALGVLRLLIVALFSLLLVVPGIVMAYSYRMAFMLLADNPDWSPWRALQESRQLMYGHRWRLACLDASFIGWFLLMWLTAGLAGLFVLPYFMTANAAFYEDLLDRTGR